MVNKKSNRMVSKTGKVARRLSWKELAEVAWPSITLREHKQGDVGKNRLPVYIPFGRGAMPVKTCFYR